MEEKKISSIERSEKGWEMMPRQRQKHPGFKKRNPWAVEQGEKDAKRDIR